MDLRTKKNPADWVEAARLTVVTGHLGSGKTEFSVNLALELAARGYAAAIADLDVVDPYFRSRDCKDLFLRHGVRLIGSSQACLDADVPVMPPEVQVLFDNPKLYGVFDVGGDGGGARVLARYRRKLLDQKARIFCVVNANRPRTNTAKKAVSYIREIEHAAGLPVNGLIHNTHLCGQTERQDIINGGKVLCEVAEATGIPLICHTVSAEWAETFDLPDFPVFPINLYMKKPWESIPTERS